MKVTSDSPQETMKIGQELGRLLRSGSVVLLKGTLGAGKTHFAKGVAEGLGVDGHVTSPTFTIVNEYEGRMPLFHIDAYRLEEESEAWEIGLEEFVDSSGVTLIEWPDRIRSMLPSDVLEVAIDFAGPLEERRLLDFSAHGAKAVEIVEELKKRVRFRD